MAGWIPAFAGMTRLAASHPSSFRRKPESTAWDSPETARLPERTTNASPNGWGAAPPAWRTLGAMSTLLDRLNGALSDAMESVRDALVQVNVPGRGGGAGIVWRDDGLIVTNAHVVGRGPAEVVLRDGRRLDARLVARSRRLDLAVLSVEVPGEAPGLHAAPIGDSTALRAGELVFALGHPFGVAGAVTSGVVIGLEPDGPAARRHDGEREWLVLHMRLRPGNSGGPVLDARGRVVGISTIMAGPGVGMAVPSHVVASFLGERAEQPQAQSQRI